MEVGGKLSELNMTVDEVDKLTSAFKDEKFREMLRDYAREISDPENKKRYEEEIKLLEQERGNSIEFVHPTPFRSFKTSVNGKQKCFVNICGSDAVGKPECKPGVSDEGRRGQCWSLPHSLHPGRPDVDAKGSKVMIYDVVFHPDTLHIASRNKKFMDMVSSTAVMGIQNTFKVTLDKNNAREMNTKYKGTPQPCIIRKPIPGYKAKEPSEKPDPLAFPYPGEKRPTTSGHNKRTESPPTKRNSDVEPKSFQTQPPKAKEPTKPNYTVKYRSVIDLQDFRCSRDSAQSPRPKEVVVTIDLPLLKSVTDASLEVQHKCLLLETKEPAYRLELSLAYPVDEDKGEAKFNKQRGQLTVTLPVLPFNEAFDFAIVSDDQRLSDGEKTGEEEEGELKEEEREGNESEEGEQRSVGEEKEKEERKIQEWDLKQQARVEEEEEERGQGQGKEQMSNTQETVEGNRKGQKSMEVERGVGEQEVEEEKLKEQENRKEVGKSDLEKMNAKRHNSMFNICDLRGDGCDRAAANSVRTDFKCDIDSDEHTGLPVEEENSAAAENRPAASPKTETHHTGEEGEVKMDSCLQSTPKINMSDIQQNGETGQTVGATLKVEADTAFQNQSSSEESQTSAAVFSTPTTITSNQSVVKDQCTFQGNVDLSKPPVAKSNTGSSGDRTTAFSEELSIGAEKQETDEDDLPSERGMKPVILRETDEDGNEIIISDHSTSAGITFQNTLMYELD